MVCGAAASDEEQVKVPKKGTLRFPSWLHGFCGGMALYSCAQLAFYASSYMAYVAYADSYVSSSQQKSK